MLKTGGQARRLRTEPQERASAGSGRPRLARLKRDRILLLATVPGLAALLLFHYLPWVGNVIAFKDYQPYIGIWNSPWSGLSNFSVIFNGDPAFVNALINTLVITLLQVVIVFPAPIPLALLLDSLA